MTYQLDKSGAVLVQLGQIEGEPWSKAVTWPDLDAFTQGYVEALLRYGWQRCIQANIGFRDLAPETLATIIRDCRLGLKMTSFEDHPRSGEGFWLARREQFERYPEPWRFREFFPPLTPTLGDDGLVRFA